ncbi:hypothetical protein SAVIM338S_00493 [Streptomyces avidinii]
MHSHSTEHPASAPAEAPAPAPALLTVYLNDHLTGSGAGVRLSRRMAKRQGRADADGARDLATLAAHVEEDQRSLRRIMRDLGVPVRRVREVAGRIGERAGMLKLNGRILSRSPLSDVVELETMLLGVTGKAACWRALRELADTEPRLDASDIDRLLARSDAQARTLEDQRRRRAAEVFAADLAGTASDGTRADRPERSTGSKRPKGSDAPARRSGPGRPAHP